LVWSIISLGHHLLTVDKVSHGCPPLANFWCLSNFVPNWKLYFFSRVRT
jgi:hypothetical protein